MRPGTALFLPSLSLLPVPPLFLGLTIIMDYCRELMKENRGVRGKRIKPEMPCGSSMDVLPCFLCFQTFLTFSSFWGFQRFQVWKGATARLWIWYRCSPSRSHSMQWPGGGAASPPSSLATLMASDLLGKYHQDGKEWRRRRSFSFFSLWMMWDRILAAGPRRPRFPPREPQKLRRRHGLYVTEQMARDLWQLFLLPRLKEDPLVVGGGEEKTKKNYTPAPHSAAFTSPTPLATAHVC